MSDTETTFGREPVEVVEIITPACVNEHGVGACSSTSVGDAKCYDTRATCDRINDFQSRPLRNLTATEVLEQLESGDSGLYDDELPFTFEADVRFKTNSAGCILEFGGGNRGVYIGVTNGQLVWRAGNQTPSASGGTNTGRIAVDVAPYEGGNWTIIAKAKWGGVGLECTMSLWLFDPVELKLTLLGEDTFTGESGGLISSGAPQIGQVVGSFPTGESAENFNGIISIARTYNNQDPVMGKPSLWKPHNILPRFTQWSQLSNTTITENISDPDGGDRAFRFQHTNSSADCYHQIDTLADDVWKFKLRVKANSATTQFFRVFLLNQACWFDMANDFAVGTNQMAFAPVVTDIGGGWFEIECTNTLTFDQAAGVNGIFINIGNGSILEDTVASADVYKMHMIRGDLDGVEDSGDPWRTYLETPTLRGPELIPNGTFDENIDGWVPIGSGSDVVWDGGQIRVISTTANGPQEIIPTTAGLSYLVEGDVTGTSAASCMIRAYTDGVVGAGPYVESNVLTAAGRCRFTFTATGTETSIYLRNSTSGWTTWDNITVRQIADTTAPPERAWGATWCIDTANEIYRQDGFDMDLSHQLDFTRGSVAYYTDSDGVMKEAAIDTPRVDYKVPSGKLARPFIRNIVDDSEPDVIHFTPHADASETQGTGIAGSGKSVIVTRTGSPGSVDTGYLAGSLDTTGAGGTAYVITGKRYTMTALVRPVFTDPLTETSFQWLDGLAVGVNGAGELYTASYGDFAGATLDGGVLEVEPGIYRIWVTAAATSTSTQNGTFWIYSDRGNTPGTSQVGNAAEWAELQIYQGEYYPDQYVVTEGGANIQTALWEDEPAEVRGLLIEESRTNEWLVDLDDASWTTLNCTKTVVSDSEETAPLPGQTVIKITESDTSGASGNIYLQEVQAITGATGERHICSIYAKAAELSDLEMWVMTGGNNRVQTTFDLLTGQVSTLSGVSPGIGVAAYMEYAGNGWWRCVLSAEDGDGTASIRTLLWPKRDGGSRNRVGDGQSSMYLTMPMYELGTAFDDLRWGVASSYTPPNTTRSADNATFPAGDWYDDKRQVWAIELETRIGSQGANSEELGQLGILNGNASTSPTNKTIFYANSASANFNSYDGTNSAGVGDRPAYTDGLLQPVIRNLAFMYDDADSGRIILASDLGVGANGTNRDFTGFTQFRLGGRLGTASGPVGLLWVKSLRYAPIAGLSSDDVEAIAVNPAVLPCKDQSDAYRQRLLFDDGRKAKPSDDVYIIPLLTQAQTVGTRLNLTGSDSRYEPLGRRAFANFSFADAPHTDFKVDPYLATRASDPLTKSTFWAKWLQRNKFGKTRAIVRRYTGYNGQALADMRRQTYVVDKADWQRESLSLNCRDFLSLTEFRRAQVPPASSGQLAVELTESATEFLVKGDVTEEYPTEGTVRIGDELIKYMGTSYSSSGDRTSFTITFRATDGSGIDSHDEDEAVQICRRYVNARIDDVLEELIVDDAGVPAQLVNLPQLTLETDTALAAYALDTVISEPTGVDRLIGEIAEDCSFVTWWDERSQLIDFKAIQPVDTVDANLTQRDNIIADSFSLVERPKERVTTISMFYNPRNFAGDLQKPSNFANQLIVANSSSQGIDQYGELPQTREVFSRWLTTEAQMNQTGSRYALRFADVPTYAGFMIDAKDRRLWVGNFVTIEHDLLVNSQGELIGADRRWFIIEAEEPEAGHSQKLTCVDVTLDGQIYLITADGIGNYTAELFEQFNAFITDNDGLNSDGTPGATIG